VANCLKPRGEGGLTKCYSFLTFNVFLVYCCWTFHLKRTSNTNSFYSCTHQRK